MNVDIIALDQQVDAQVAQAVKGCGHQPHSYPSLESARISAKKPDLIFIEWAAPALVADLYRWLAAPERSTWPPVIVLFRPEAAGQIERLSDLGVFECLEIQLPLETGAIAHLCRLLPMLQELRNKGIIGESRPFLECLKEVCEAALDDLPVLLCGETGTGKSAIAELIHQLSGRGGRFLEVNVAAITVTLAETQLLGIAARAVPGVAPRAGPFERVGKGSLFLNEVQGLHAEIQDKLLDVVEGKPFQRVGANEDLKFEGRLISATTADLRARAEDGAFNASLFYRLAARCIRLPSLRERHEDIAPLIEHFVKEYASGRDAQFDQESLRALQEYDYPGNVRELRDLLKDSVNRSHGTRILRAPPHVLKRRASGPLPQSSPPSVSGRTKPNSPQECRPSANDGFYTLKVPRLLVSHGTGGDSKPTAGDPILIKVPWHLLGCRTWPPEPTDPLWKQYEKQVESAAIKAVQKCKTEPLGQEEESNLVKAAREAALTYQRARQLAESQVDREFLGALAETGHGWQSAAERIFGINRGTASEYWQAVEKMQGKPDASRQDDSTGSQEAG
jgi:DNA-binding NtrC family response regulator